MIPNIYSSYLRLLLNNRRSVLIPLFSRSGPRYCIREDAMVNGRFQFCVRLKLGWPLVRWGWRPR